MSMYTDLTRVTNPLFLPFGTRDQLKLRQHCSICRLVLSLIVTDPVSKALHPRLASMDIEIQGTTFHVSEVLGKSERVLVVEYGIRKVGELRIVTNGNRATAI